MTQYQITLSQEDLRGLFSGDEGLARLTYLAGLLPKQNEIIISAISATKAMTAIQSGT